MRHLNCIVVFDQKKERVLFCKRVKEPYKGMYNFVGGKVEPGEQSFHAAYRELQEETGISRADISLFRLMDFTYYDQDFVLEIYVGQLHGDVELAEELNPLEWLPLTENFADRDRFAGDQNIAHIINVALKFPLEERRTVRSVGMDSAVRCCSVGSLVDNARSVGIDGCHGGWIAAVIDGGKLSLHRFDALEGAMEALPFDACLIDMVIGLQGKKEQVRPDKQAREILGKRHVTVFSAPCREAVYAYEKAAYESAAEREEAKREQKLANQRVLQVSLSDQSCSIIPQIREVDEFLQSHPEYKNRLQESHPEVCFARLNGEALGTSKKSKEGVGERVSVLAGYLPDITVEWIWKMKKELKCEAHDINDAICLAITANLSLQGETETIPPEPEADDVGLLMQMVIPKCSRLADVICCEL